MQVSHGCDHFTSFSSVGILALGFITAAHVKNDNHLNPRVKEGKQEILDDFLGWVI